MLTVLRLEVIVLKKVHSLSKKKIDEISSLIGASFWDYPYEPGEGGLKPFFPSKAAMTEYMKSFVIAGMESGTFYSTDSLCRSVWRRQCC